MFVGEIIWTLRMSLGDLAAIDASGNLTDTDNYVFWVLWILTVTITNIIFLNFIVAEASASYTKVTETLESVIWKERTALINESEEMTFASRKNNQKLPKYLIIRETEL